MPLAADTRFCEQCVSLKPIAEFRKRSRTGSAHLNQCRTCHNRAERERRAKNRAMRGHRRMAKFLTQLNNEKSNDRLRLLSSVMFQQFGGMEGFVSAWADYQHQAMEQGGFAAFRCFQTVVRLLQYCEETRPDPVGMTDEELERSVMEHTKQLIQQHPELAVAAASEVGWTIVASQRE
jgi:hypothetical protein